MKLCQGNTRHLKAGASGESYGTDAKAIKALAENILNGMKNPPRLPNILGRSNLGVRNEMAMKLEDVLSRRIRIPDFWMRRPAIDSAPKVAKTDGRRNETKMLMGGKWNWGWFSLKTAR